MEVNLVMMGRSIGLNDSYIRSNFEILTKCRHFEKKYEEYALRCEIGYVKSKRASTRVFLYINKNQKMS